MTGGVGSKPVINLSHTRGKKLKSQATKALARLSESYVHVCEAGHHHQGSCSVPLEIHGWDNPDPAPQRGGQDHSQSLKVNSSHPLHSLASPAFAGDSRALASHHICVL